MTYDGGAPQRHGSPAAAAAQPWQLYVSLWVTIKSGVTVEMTEEKEKTAREKKSETEERKEKKKERN